METAGTSSVAGATKKKGSEQQMLDGSNIMKLVGDEEVFSSFVDHKFHELDRDKDGQLSVRELQPAVADIGAALGLPAQGSSPESDHIYSEVSFFLSFFYMNIYPNIIIICMIFIPFFCFREKTRSPCYGFMLSMSINVFNFGN